MFVVLRASGAPGFWASGVFDLLDMAMVPALLLLCWTELGPNSEGGRLGLVGKGLIDARTWFLIGVNSGRLIA